MIGNYQYKILNKINNPDDLKKLSLDDLKILKDELRHYIIEIVAKSQGHLGGNLGVIELTIALHYVYNTPFDKIIWDVGHQSYAHKILTGRRDQMNSLRKMGGISGFPSIFESKYDAFGTGHSSTSISAALGMAVAIQLSKNKNKVVAVIGDGAMTGGMAFEALNNVGQLKPNILIILNDNKISIDENVGGLKDYLLDIATSKTYNTTKENVWRLLSKFGKLGPNPTSLVQRIDNALKSIVLHYSNLFEAFGIRYFGPVNGHDIPRLIKTLEQLRTIPGPKLLHIHTQKGKGFALAERNQTAWHAAGNFDKITGEPLNKPHTPQPPKYQDVFGLTILDLAKKNPKIVTITPAMVSGSSLTYMMDEMPDRVFDVGIAEQHAVTFSAGLAKEGYKPFTAIYSTFLQRGYDQLIHDVALQKLNVTFCIDRGGLVGEDGVTHQGVFDIAYLRPIPNIIIAAPMNEEDLRNLLYTVQTKNFGTVAIRYPRGRGVMLDWKTPYKKIPIGKAQKISAENLDEKIGGNFPDDEIGELAATFDEMIKRLKLSFQELNQFSADVSHELRTPLTVLQGEVEVALRGDRTKEEYVKVLKSNLEEIKRLHRIVESLLFLSKAESGKILYKLKELDALELILTIYSTVKSIADEKNIKIEIDGIPGIIIKGDEDLLVQMFYNVIHNAIKYNKKGGKVSISIKDYENRVDFIIKDTGQGIPENQLKQIFHRFYRTDKSRARKEGGFGLGLNIVKKIADIHNATINVESTVNKGTTFIISFPK